MKEFRTKLTNVLKTIFGYGIYLTVFGGGLTFFGFLAALLIGGETATAICVFIQKSIFPVLIYVSVLMVLLGLVVMYLNGQVALTPEKKHAHKHEGEM